MPPSRVAGVSPTEQWKADGALIRALKKVEVAHILLQTFEDKHPSAVAEVQSKEKWR